MTERVSGIYKIVNRINGKYYVGSSINILGTPGRFYNHKRHLRRGKHHCDHLQNAYNKYGSENFEYIVVEQVDPIRDVLLAAEQRYLDIAKTEQHLCYNSSFIAGTIEMTDAVRKKLSITGKGRIPSIKFTGHRADSIEKIRAALIGKPSHALGKRWKCPACSDRCKGSGNPNADQTTYTFINVVTQETFVGKKCDFVVKYNLPKWYPYGIIKQGKTKRGWKLYLSPSKQLSGSIRA